MRRLSLAVLIVAAFAGCGDEPEPTVAPTPSPAATSTPSPSPSPEPAIDPLEGASTDPSTAPATNQDVALLTDVRAARHEGYDRVVFEFGNEVPGYDVRYVTPPLQQDGSGDEVEIAGNHVVQVRMEPSLDADLSQESAPPTYTGPQRFQPGTPEVVELARVGGFEAVLTWGIGLQDRVDFRVTTLTSPSRLVIDFRNH